MKEGSSTYRDLLLLSVLQGRTLAYFLGFLLRTGRNAVEMFLLSLLQTGRNAARFLKQEK